MTDPRTQLEMHQALAMLAADRGLPEPTTLTFQSLAEMRWVTMHFGSRTVVSAWATELGLDPPQSTDLSIRAPYVVATGRWRGWNIHLYGEVAAEPVGSER